MQSFMTVTAGYHGDVLFLTIIANNNINRCTDAVSKVTKRAPNTPGAISELSAVL